MDSSVVVLGGFSSVPPGTAPGWVMAVKSRHGRTWIVAVTTDEIRHTYQVWITNRIPWDKWIGGRAKPGIYRGDVPEQAEQAGRYHGR